MADYKASQTLIVRLTDKTQSRLWLTNLDVSVIEYVVLALSPDKTPCGSKDLLLTTQLDPSSMCQ